MANVFNYSTDNPNIFLIMIDESGSMKCERSNVLKGMQMFQEDFNNFAEADSIAVSVSTFSEGVRLGEFKKVRDINFNSYYPNNGTWLNYAIVKGAEYLKNYMYQVAVKTGVEPRGTFIVLSDGMPEGDPRKGDDTRVAINDLNLSAVTTVFCAFGRAITSDWGSKHSFQSTIKVDSNTNLINFLGKELSKSCKAQSQSLKALGADFFSQAKKPEASKNYSAHASAVLQDESWFDEI